MYWGWIENYIAEDFVVAVNTGRGMCAWTETKAGLLTDLELLERHAVQQSQSRIEELVKIFIHATRVSSRLPHIQCVSDCLYDHRWRLGSGKCFRPHELE